MNYLNMEIEHSTLGHGIVISKSFAKEYIGSDGMYVVYFLFLNKTVDINIEKEILDGNITLCIQVYCCWRNAGSRCRLC